MPIKASDFHQKPTLKSLQSRFEINEQQRQPDKTKLKNAIDFALHGEENVSLERLSKTMNRDGIDIILRKNESGLIYGITYVDHRTKSVFNGSSLGKNYSAKAIQERCAPADNPAQNRLVNEQKIGRSKMDFDDRRFSRSNDFTISDGHPFNENITSNDTDALFDPVRQDGYMPGQVRSTKRKKKKGLSQSL